MFYGIEWVIGVVLMAGDVNVMSIRETAAMKTNFSGVLRCEAFLLTFAIYIRNRKICILVLFAYCVTNDEWERQYANVMFLFYYRKSPKCYSKYIVAFPKAVVQYCMIAGPFKLAHDGSYTR